MYVSSALAVGHAEGLGHSPRKAPRQAWKRLLWAAQLEFGTKIPSLPGTVQFCDGGEERENPYVYAAGDVIGKDMFVYVAAYAGGLAAENALLRSGRVFDASYIARITFTDPQIASAGLTEAQAREAGHEVKTSTLPMAYVPRALAARDTAG